MHQVRFGGLYCRLSAEADRHSNTSDSDSTDNEELGTTFPDQWRRVSPNHAVSEVPASRPSDHDSGPTPASMYGAHADPERSDGTPNTLYPRQKFPKFAGFFPIFARIFPTFV